MKLRSTLAASALGLGLAISPAAASWAASYPPAQPSAGETGVSPSDRGEVSPSDRGDTVAGGNLPRTGSGIALAGAAGAALIGGGAILVGVARRPRTTD